MPKTGEYRSTAGRALITKAYERALAELPEGRTTSEVATSWGTVRAYRWRGSASNAPTVVLLPGRGAGAPMWADVLPSLLATGHDVVAVDAVGDVGMSIQTAPMRSFDDQARWLDEALEALDIARVHLVGHSFGGAIALTHAASHPRRVASLALIEPVFVLCWPPPSTFVWATVLALPAPRRWRDRALAALGGVDVTAVRAETALGALIDVGARHFASSIPNPRPLSSTALAGVDAPTYVALADRSLAGGERAAKRARLIPDVVVETWPGTTHSLPMQVTDELVDRLSDFWAGHDT